jgi:hypothetical protein
MADIDPLESRAHALLELHEAIQCVIRETRGFNERKQEIWCRICRNRDLEALHDPDCPIYLLHGAWEAVDLRELAQQRQEIEHLKAEKDARGA